MNIVTLLRQSALPLILAVVLLTASSVLAQFHGSASAPVGGLQWAVQPTTTSANVSLPSESAARAWSLWSTLIPTTAGMILGGHDNIVAANILVGTGMIIGPSTGYFYGGCSGRGATGILIRSATVAATTLAAVAIWEAGPQEGWDQLGNAVVVMGVIGAGTVILIYEVIHDIAHVKGEVRDRNDEIRSASLSLAPTYFVQSNAYGLQLTLKL